MSAIFGFFISLLLFMACTNNSMDKLQTSFNYNGKSYPDREAAAKAMRAEINTNLSQIPIASQHIPGSVLIVLPSRDVFKKFNTLTITNSLTADQEYEGLELNLDLKESISAAMAESVKMGKVFDKVTIILASEPDSYPSKGYDFKLWVSALSYDMPWYLGKTGLAVWEGLKVNKGATEQQQFFGFNQAVIDAANLLNSGGGKHLSSNKSFGTGFFINMDSMAISNAHVVQNCNKLTAVLQNGESVFASLIAKDKFNDLALLKIEVQNTHYAELRTQAIVRQGEEVVIYGFPLTGALAVKGNLSSGIVSALSGLDDNTSKLQISAPIQPGNSGGPVLDQTGKVIGMVEYKLNAVKTAAMTGDIPQNVNFAIKASVVKDFLQAKSVTVPTETAKHKTLSIEDIGDLAKAFTIMLECN